MLQKVVLFVYHFMLIRTFYVPFLDLIMSIFRVLNSYLLGTLIIYMYTTCIHVEGNTGYTLHTMVSIPYIGYSVCTHYGVSTLTTCWCT